MTEPGVRVLVDGYNVTKAPGGFADVDLEVQRQLLIDALERFGRRRRVAFSVVFDGSETPPGTSRRSRGVVDVRYSSARQSADDHLVELLEVLPADPVVVVTDDRELRGRVAALGATPARSRQLLQLIR